jgi:hypothetical protein
MVHIFMVHGFDALVEICGQKLPYVIIVKKIDLMDGTTELKILFNLACIIFSFF